MRSLINTSLALLLVLPALSCAQEGRSAERKPKEPPTASQGQLKADQEDDQSPRRLETITWNSVKHELTWVISKGDKKGADYQPTGSEDYLINMDDATMAFHGQKRGFSKEEAANVHVLMDVISKYAIDSTVWWDEGHGIPLDKNGSPKVTKPQTDPSRDDSVAVLHVAATSPVVLERAEVDRQIRALQERLAELQRLRRRMGTTELASY